MAQEIPSICVSATHAPDVQVFSDAAALADAGARHFARRAAESVLRQGRFTVALSGGSTPRAMLALLSAEPFKTSVPWGEVYFFWGDERSVPPDHADSNYKMAHDALLAHVTVPPENVLRIRAEFGAERAAAEYSAELRRFFSLSGPDDLPRLDLVFLGMGADGHTASLFPGTTALAAGREIAVSTWVEKLQSHRVTLTAETINAAAEVLFLVAGGDKAETLKAVLGGERQPEKYPSQLIRPARGSLLWYVDAAAAEGLRQGS
jgi:6-phosphogluconolactonase